MYHFILISSTDDIPEEKHQIYCKNHILPYCKNGQKPTRFCNCYQCSFLPYEYLRTKPVLGNCSCHEQDDDLHHALSDSFRKLMYGEESKEG